MTSDKQQVRETDLVQWMQAYGDSVLRTCYLLCGNKHEAHRAAQQVFQQACTQIYTTECPSIHAFLIQIAIEQCPCKRIFLQRACKNSVAARILSLSPALRKVAILCLYHQFPHKEAACILHISENQLADMLRLAEQTLSIASP